MTPSDTQLDKILDHLTCAHHIIDKAGCVGCEPKQALRDLMLDAVMEELRDVRPGEDSDVKHLERVINNRIAELTAQKGRRNG